MQIKSLLYFISSIHFLSFFTHSSRLVFLGKNTITKRATRHPYRTRSKSRTMGDQEETQEQMKADMSALKEQMASMMEAMLGMKQLMEKNAATAAAVSSAAEADPTLLATAYHPPSNIVGRGRDTLGHDGSPQLGYNRAAYPYGFPPNYSPPVLQEDAGHIALPSLKKSHLSSPTKSIKTLKIMLGGMSSFIPRSPKGRHQARCLNPTSRHHQ